MKPSGESQNSVPSKYALLDLLVDGPSSVAALFAGAVRHLGLSPDTPVRSVVEALEELRTEDCVRAWLETEEPIREPASKWEIEALIREYDRWLPQQSPDHVTVDEVGLWYEITQAGRRFWAEGGEPSERWTVDEDAGLITVRAPTRAAAETVLRQWLKGRSLRAPDQTMIRTGIAFHLADGSRVEDGVELRCRLADDQ